MRVLSTIVILVFFISGAYAKEASPSDVYKQVVMIQQELELIKKYFKITKKAQYEKVKTSQLAPRHTWQKAYEILVKINILRRTNGMSVIEPVNLEPRIKLKPILVYEMTQRILTEIKIFKYRHDIAEQIKKVPNFHNKTPIDVFNKLREVSIDMDIINGLEFTPSYVFGEAMRIYEDISMILKQLKIEDKSVPPLKPSDAQPKDAFEQGMRVLKKIIDLESSIGVETLDMNAFIRQDVEPGHVYELTQIILAELQVVKASVGIRNKITPAAIYYSQKRPSDVYQVFGWSYNKLNQISGLR